MAKAEEVSNNEIQEVFVDGIANVNLSLGAFRFDLVSLKSAPTGDENPDLDHHVRVIMTPQGYLQTVTALQNFLQQVEDKGIIRREAVDTENVSAEEEGIKGKGKK